MRHLLAELASNAVAAVLAMGKRSRCAVAIGQQKDGSMHDEPSIPNMVEVYVSQGHMRANAAKLKLEAAGIPAMLSYESVGRVWGLTVDGLGEVRVLVPERYATEAQALLEEQELAAELREQPPGQASMLDRTADDKGGQMSEEKTVREEFRISGEQVVKKVKELVHEGNIRRVIVKQDNRTLMEIPLTLGVAGILLAPTLAALGALAALVTECTIVVEKSE